MRQIVQVIRLSPGNESDHADQEFVWPAIHTKVVHEPQWEQIIQIIQITQIIWPMCERANDY